MIELDTIQGDIRLREHDHTYWHVPTGKQLTSVSEVIRVVYAAKSWNGVDPAVVEHARLRGSAVDRYISEYVQRGSIHIAGESSEVCERVVIAQRLFEREFSGLPAEPQRIVHNLDDGVAGTIDLWVDNRFLVDLKCTYSTEHSWVLQLGAYATYAPSVPERIGVIHVSPKVYADGGRWIEYDPVACRAIWNDAVYWWKRTKNLTQHGLAHTKRRPL